MKALTRVAPLFLFVLLVAANASAAMIVTLIDENFASGSAAGATWTSSAGGVSNGQQWTWTGLSGETSVTTEVWVGAGGATGRGLSTTYDHDQNGGTAQINIPGGFEVMSGYTSNGLPDELRVGVNVVLPGNLTDTVDGTLTYFVANRIISGSGGQGAQVSVFNVTDNLFILPATIIDVNTPNGAAGWNFKLNNLNFQPSDAGDTIQVRFREIITSGASPGARGLEVADVTLTVTIPEPSSFFTLLFGGVALFARQRRSRQMWHASRGVCI